MPFRETPVERLSPNLPTKLPVLHNQQDEGISLHVGAVAMDFKYADYFGGGGM